VKTLAFMKSVIVGSIFTTVAYAARIVQLAPVIHDESTRFDPGALANRYSETINNWQTIAMLEHKSEKCEKGLEELGKQLVTEAVERTTAMRAACANWNSVECNRKQKALYEFEEKQNAKCKASGHICHYTMTTSNGKEKIDTCMPKACHQDVLAEHAKKSLFTEIQCGESLNPQPSLLQKMEQDFNPVKPAAPSVTGANARNKVVLKAEGGTGVDVVDSVGILPPVGFFDPLGLSEDRTEEKILRWREIELKHGRQSMLAALGFLIGEQFHPLFPDLNDNIPSALVWQEEAMKPISAAIIFAIAVLEAGGANRAAMGLRPGDYEFDPLGLRPDDPDELDELQTKEIQNGRLAMLGIAGMVAQEMVDKQTILDKAGQLR